LQEYLASVNQYIITFLLKYLWYFNKTEGMGAEKTWQSIEALNLKQLD